ncbi:MAG: fatty acid desaturase [Jaaginema sp. PMC 1079.18]|nr:fatty acid desaturase [Jaaginema sp. PMC 1080.18]MEC4853730.1 fatty acid desaturase [Jaaginema sp. PMC 1079.18]MEC4869103.1 fatty acid desaturase [Jaaginema sp. PMC 1078.18]
MTVDSEWHIQRQKEILLAHPEIKQYFCYYPYSLVPLVLLVLLQWSIAITMSLMPWWGVGLFALFLGQFICHAIATFIHEAAHQRILKTQLGNSFVLFIIEVGSLSFAKSAEYVAKHGSSHHRYLNDYIRDYEWWDRIQVNRLKCKPLWRCTEALLHLLPAGSIVGDILVDWLSEKDVTRIIERRNLNLSFQYFLMLTSLSLYLMAWQFIGWQTALYFAWSISIMVGNWGITMKGQSIAEHNIENNGRTYSTYGWINIFLFNTGYHDEHHTFPQIPWVYLPIVRKLAPSYFQNSSGKSYFFWWWCWAKSGFQPEKFHRFGIKPRYTQKTFAID